jgi:predicted alpha/beta hydrolase family esterase
MQNAIIIHGLQSEREYLDPLKPSPSNAQWLPWIQNQLNIKGILAQTPEMPTPYAPDYPKWKVLFEQFTVSEHTALIGHSLGGGFLLRWLSENPSQVVGQVVLVAPWLDTERRLEGDFFNFTLDSDIASRCKALTVFYSNNDMERINMTLSLCKKTLVGVEFIELPEKGHFLTKHMGTDAFPELLQLFE